MMDSQSNIAVVILAAGASSRMGEPKQLLKWGHTTLLGHAIKTVKEIGVQDIILVLGANFELIGKEVNDKSITILNNTNWKQGMGTSIAIAVKHLQQFKMHTKGVLFVLCDQPFITRDYLKTMVSTFKQNTNQIITTSYENGKQGVPALFDASYFDELSQLKDDYGARYILEKYHHKVETLVPPTKNMDLDTKADYANLYRSTFNNQ